jgi:hypothetical protein
MEVSSCLPSPQTSTLRLLLKVQISRSRVRVVLATNTLLARNFMGVGSRWDGRAGNFHKSGRKKDPPYSSYAPRGGRSPTRRKSAAPEPVERISTLTVSVKTGRAAALRTPRQAPFWGPRHPAYSRESGLALAAASPSFPKTASSLFGPEKPVPRPVPAKQDRGVMGIGQKPAKRGTGRFFAASLAKNTGPTF